MANKGQFVYYKTASGYINYRLKASNKETIAVSGGTGYSSLSACKKGIESVKKNFVKADAQYIYSVTFLLNDTTEAPKWRVAQLVPSVPNEAKISLDLEVN